MKKLMLLASACLMLNGTAVLAQTARGGAQNPRNNVEQGKPLTYKVKVDRDAKILITMFSSKVQIIGHNSDEVVIETSNYTPAPARADGLKPLYNQAEDNTGVGLAVGKEGNTLKITKASRKGGEFTIRVPRRASVVYEEADWTGDDLTLADVDGEIELKLNNSGATLTHVSGPIIANTTAGDITIKFSSLNQSKPSAISSVAGTVDIALPANTKANFKLKTIQGEVYTDFDMNLDKNSQGDLTKIAGGNNINGKTNGGGVEVSVYTISNDMFIRKKK